MGIDFKDNHTLTLRLWQFKHEYVGRIFFREPALAAPEASGGLFLAPSPEDISFTRVLLGAVQIIAGY
jgi:hypothetical protein